MFDNLPPNAVSMIERMQAAAPRTQQATPEELDVVIEQLLVPLFKKRGITIDATKDDDGWTLRLDYK